jgi:hypothetical protein
MYLTYVNAPGGNFMDDDIAIPEKYSLLKSRLPPGSQLSPERSASRRRCMDVTLNPGAALLSMSVTLLPVCLPGSASLQAQGIHNHK